MINLSQSLREFLSHKLDDILSFFERRGIVVFIYHIRMKNLTHSHVFINSEVGRILWHLVQLLLRNELTHIGILLEGIQLAGIHLELSLIHI